MGTFWHKPGYTAADRDADGEIRADALRPGIYCEDEAAYRELLAQGEARADLGHYSMFDGGPDEDRPLGWMAHTIHGVRIRVATPAEAATLRATSTVTPEESLAEQRLAHEAGLAAWARISESLAFDPIGPDGKVDVVARDVRPPDRTVLEELALMMGDMTAQDMAEERTRVTRAMVRQAVRGMGAEEFGRRFVKHAPAGANRKARRAAAAQARRGA